jgi:threonine dehydratase
MQMPITHAQVEEARRNIAPVALQTPLVRCNTDVPAELYLKLENLQPIGSFKIRGAANVMARTLREQLERGVLTASAGNMAQGVAFCARRMGVRHNCGSGNSSGNEDCRGRANGRPRDQSSICRVVAHL